MNNSDRMMFQQKSSLSAVFEKRSEMAVFKFLGNFHYLSSLKMFFFVYFSWLAFCEKCLSTKILVFEVWIKNIITSNIASFCKFNIIVDDIIPWG